MKWDSVQLAAKSKGHLVFAMDQAQTAVLTQPGPWGSAFDGYCIGLAASWVSLKYQGKNFPIDGAQVCDNPPWQATQAQNLSDALKRPDWTDWWKVATEPFQCRLSDGLRGIRAYKPTASFLYAMAAHAYGCYGVYLSGEDGAHAIALRHTRSNRLHIFDPNYFEISAPMGDPAKALLRWFLDQTGYGKEYAKRTGVVGIKPPVNGA
jgi:hypothetical protein